jgi:N-ethylmaleimide reductase
MTTDTLFEPVRLGAAELRNRIAMAPMTRNRSGDGNAPVALNVEYYAQRAGAGLIVTEGTQPSAGGLGYPGTPGMHTDAQEQGWKAVVDAVHAGGSAISLQLMHTGRVSHPDLLPDGLHPVAPSAVAPAGQVFNGSELVPYETPRALGADELPAVAREFADATARARRAGFDAVELHGAYGYLLQQFLSSNANVREDAYGGSVENRIRFVVEAVAAAVEAGGRDYVGIRLSPSTPQNDVREDDAQDVYLALLAALQPLDLAYLHVVESPQDAGYSAVDLVRANWDGVVIANSGRLAPWSPEEAAAIVAGGRADLVAFGRHTLANPDLVERIRTGAPLAEADPSTFYGGDARGYTDYPTFAEAEASQLQSGT